MLPANLIKLIEEGQAQLKTWTTGATGSQRIPVPRDSYVVIVGWTYHHFVDQSTGVPFDMLEVLKNVVHNVKFASDANHTFMYCVRSAFTPQLWNGNEFIVPVIPDTHYETYQIHKTDVHIDIWRLPDYSKWATTYNKLAATTSEPAGPIGYGSTQNPPSQNVIKQIFFGGGTLQQYLPYGDLNNITPIVGEFREQFFANIDANSLLLPPALDQTGGNYTYPIINIDYVLIDKALPSHVK